MDLCCRGGGWRAGRGQVKEFREKKQTEANNKNLVDTDHSVGMSRGEGVGEAGEGQEG